MTWVHQYTVITHMYIASAYNLHYTQIYIHMNCAHHLNYLLITADDIVNNKIITATGIHFAILNKIY